MNFPDLEVLATIGTQVKRNVAKAEAIVLGELGVSDSLQSCLMGERDE